MRTIILSLVTAVLLGAACHHAATAVPARSNPTVATTTVAAGSRPGETCHKEWIENDPDLASIRGTPRYEAILQAM